MGYNAFPCSGGTSWSELAVLGDAESEAAWLRRLCTCATSFISGAQAVSLWIRGSTYGEEHGVRHGAERHFERFRGEMSG